MDLTYLRSRAKQFRAAQNEAERQELLHKLAIHLELAHPGEGLTLGQQQRVVSVLKRLGICVQSTGTKTERGEQKALPIGDLTS